MIAEPVTGPNAGEPSQLPMWTSLTARIGQFDRWAKKRHIMKRIVITALCVGLSCLAADNPTFPKLPDSPSKLIEILKGAGERYTIGDVRVDYVEESDLTFLVSLLDSKEPCRFVDMSISSIYYPGKSTVGHEAAYLIEGFWKRYYPTGLTSQQYKPDIEGIKRWYGMWSHQKKLAEQKKECRERGGEMITGSGIQE
jgi:hypothetical protein